MLKLRTFKYYLYLIVFLVIAWIAFKVTKLTFVFNIIGDYYVVLYSDIIAIIVLPTILIAVVYWLFSKRNIKLIKSLSKIHTAATVIGLFLFVIIFSLYEFISPIGSLSRFPLFDEPEKNTVILLILYLIVILSQILFIFNLILSLIKHYFRGD